MACSQILNDIARFMKDPTSFHGDFATMAKQAFDALQTLPQEQQLQLIMHGKVSLRNTFFFFVMSSSTLRHSTDPREV
jgi:hypothetical protein